MNKDFLILVLILKKENKSLPQEAERSLAKLNYTKLMYTMGQKMGQDEGQKMGQDY